MGRLIFWLLVLGMIAGGYFIYTQNPDPADARAAVNGTFASLHSRLTQAIADAQSATDDAMEPVADTGTESPTDDGGEDTTHEPDEQVVVETPRPVAGGAGDDQTLDQYRAWISEARATHPYPDSEERMYAVMMCESGGKATAVNPAGPYSGLFQYSPDTWDADWNTYRNEDILNPRAQIFATALAWSNGMQNHWGCYSRTH